MPKYRCRLLAYGLAILSISLSTTAFAFKPKGHDAIESETYKRMSVSPEGMAILDALVATGDLDRRAPESSAIIARSGSPDVQLDRQFHKALQCYHFMASNEDVEEAVAESGGTNAMPLLLDRAYPKCISLMHFLFDEVVRNPGDATAPNWPRQKGHGLYVLMHITVDAWSPEHVVRQACGAAGDVTDCIATLKGWDSWLLSVDMPDAAREVDKNVPECLETKGFKNDSPPPVEALLHTGILSGHADECWQKNVGKNPYELTSVAMRASRSLEDLLKSVYCARALNRQDKKYYPAICGSQFEPNEQERIRAQWNKFVSGNLRRSGQQMVAPVATDNTEVYTLSDGTKYLEYQECENECSPRWAMGMLYEPLKNDVGIEFFRGLAPATTDRQVLFPFAALQYFCAASLMAFDSDTRQSTLYQVQGRVGLMVPIPIASFQIGNFYSDTWDADLRPQIGYARTFGRSHESGFVSRFDFGWTRQSDNYPIFLGLSYHVNDSDDVGRQRLLLIATIGTWNGR